MDNYTNDNQIQYPIKNQEIVKIYRSTEGKNGPYMSAKGNPFTKVDIYVDPRAIEDGEFEGKMSYFDYFENTKNWDIGTTISGSIVKNGRYFNFNLPAKPGKKSLELDIKQLQTKLEDLEKKVFGSVQGKNEVDEAMEFSEKIVEPKVEEEVDDLPF